MQDMHGMSLEDDRIDMKVDLVFVIDATESMRSMLDELKESILSFPERLLEAALLAGRAHIDLRAKVTWFRDHDCDGDQAFGESEFFALPEENGEFREAVCRITAKGGGNQPESGLEALARAMHSDFVQEGEKRRHIIMLFTDAAARPQEDHGDPEAAEKKGCAPAMYRENMQESLEALFDEWHQYRACLGSRFRLDRRGRRLILVTPWEYPWNEIWESWEYVLGIDFRQEEDRRRWADDVLSAPIV